MNGLCGFEITKECSEYPCIGCDVFQRFNASEAVEAAYGQACWEFPWTDDDLGVSEEYKRTRPTEEEHPRPF